MSPLLLSLIVAYALGVGYCYARLRDVGAGTADRWMSALIAVLWPVFVAGSL